MQNQRKALIIATALILMLVGSYVLANLTVTYHMTAPVASESVKLYSDQPCTFLISEPYTWTEPVSNGTVLNVWAKNIGNVNVAVTLSITENVNCTVILSPTSFTLNTGTVQKIDLAFSDVTGNTASWAITLDAAKL